jgi:hypothetical protein
MTRSPQSWISVGLLCSLLSVGSKTPAAQGIDIARLDDFVGAEMDGAAACARRGRGRRQGWELPRFAGRAVQRHRGVWLGFTNYLARYVDDDLTVIVLTNLVQPDEERILRFVDRIAGIVNPALARRELTPMLDRDPDVTLRVKELLMAAQARRLARDDFPYGDIGRFLPIATARYQDLLQGLGQPQRLDLVDRDQLGDDRVFVYDVRFGSKTFRVKMGIALDDKVSVLEIRPK